MSKSDSQLLAASSNARKLIVTLQPLLSTGSQTKLADALDRNVKGLLNLAEHHLAFAQSRARGHWRQQISRFYYAVYNARRAVQLHTSGHYSTDSTDHRKLEKLPSDFPGKDTKARRLTDLRDDRNLADYDHFAEEQDLVLSPKEAEEFASDFLEACTAYLSARGLKP